MTDPQASNVQPPDELVALEFIITEVMALLEVEPDLTGAQILERFEEASELARAARDEARRRYRETYGG